MGMSVLFTQFSGLRSYAFLIGTEATVVLETPFSLTPPFDAPVVIFAIAMTAFFLAPLVLERLRLPGIVGIILVGAAIGPDGFGLIGESEGIELLGEAGLIFLMFIAGLEINFNQFLAYKDRSLVFGSLSFIIPQAVGTAFGLFVLDLSLTAALLFAAIFASHTLLAYPVVSRLGIAKNEAMTATIGGTILTDTLALLVLAVAVAIHGGASGAVFWTQFALGLSVFFVGTWVVVPRISRWFFRRRAEESYYDFLFVMMILFIVAMLAELAGVKHIIGAFIVGLAVNRLIPESGPLMNRIQFVGNALFIPFFLLWVGTLVDVYAIFAGSETLLIAGGLLVMVVLTKLAAAAIAGQLYGFSRSEVLGMFGLSVGQAAAALAIVIVGADVGTPGFDEHMLNGTVLMILVTGIVSPLIVERAGKHLRQASEQEAYDPADAPQRILVPFSRDSHHWQTLVDLALFLRDERSGQALHTVSVVPPGEDHDTEEAIARLEAEMEERQEYTASVEVPLETHTRVNHNIASGISRSLVENRISMLIIGWDGANSRKQTVHGHIIDQVLNRTPQLTLVARLRIPLNTTEQITLILPPGIDHNDGFFEALHTVKRIGEQTGARVRGLAVNSNAEHLDRLYEMTEPEVPGEIESVADWQDLLELLNESVSDDELVVVMSARRDDFGWSSELQTLPKSVSTLTEGNFLIVYPSSKKREDDRRFFQYR